MTYNSVVRRGPWCWERSKQYLPPSANSLLSKLSGWKRPYRVIKPQPYCQKLICLDLNFFQLCHEVPQDGRCPLHSQPTDRLRLFQTQSRAFPDVIQVAAGIHAPWDNTILDKKTTQILLSNSHPNKEYHSYNPQN